MPKFDRSAAGGLMACRERKVRVESEDLGTSQPAPVILEGEDLSGADLLAVQLAHQDGLAGTV
jgi:hypothetical protein